MRCTRLTYYFIITYLVLITNFINASNQELNIGIEEQLGAILPGDVEFVTSEGDTTTLGKLVDMPVLLALVYYECPGICTPLQSDLSWAVTKMDLKPGEDYKLISLSFDHKETPAVARKWKKNFLESVDDELPEDSWVFLTGDSANIKKITDAAGFYFKPDDEQFVHAGAVITLSPKRKISRYLIGTTFNPFDIKMALLEAQAGKTNPAITKVLQFCFSYDPEGRGYTLNVTRIAGTAMMIGVGILFFMILKKRKPVQVKGKKNG